MDEPCYLIAPVLAFPDVAAALMAAKISFAAQPGRKPQFIVLLVSRSNEASARKVLTKVSCRPWSHTLLGWIDDCLSRVDGHPEGEVDHTEAQNLLVHIRNHMTGYKL